MAVRLAERGDGGSYPEEEPLAVQLLAMRRRHLRSVMRIELQSYPRPWSVGLFMSELALRGSRDYYVARAKGDVAGYAGMMATGEEAHVTNIAVDGKWRRNHIGTRLMIQLVRAARRRGVKHLTLEVRMGNHAAQSMYYRFGFAPAGIRKNYYVESKEDAMIMWAHDIDTPSYGQRIEAVAQRIPGSTVWTR